MKFVLTLGLILGPATAMAEDCRWAGGSFRGEDGGFQAQFEVNADCTEMTFQSSGNAGIQAQDVPQTFSLSPEGHGWVADINGVNATLAKDGNYVNFIGKGIDTRLQTRPVE
ncbi:hypothetical protein QO034_02280 [Sedimentitalea sp. JM2-8]|uniref:Protease inhibitor Inh n=1 Tax=Sedimentitalea xiamensis TaxID=3050037 RepID=A0ABT7FA01_9RHOB|nr:hypothetical protein [Sedimentitalea xiamensis]MDK3071927.1 hypothetical protein [Sedimentitalea xiamensis]